MQESRNVIREKQPLRLLLFIRLYRVTFFADLSFVELLSVEVSIVKNTSAGAQVPSSLPAPPPSAERDPYVSIGTIYIY